MLLDIFVPFQSESHAQQDYKGVSLELYGPQHLTANTFKQAGKTILRQSLVQVSRFPKRQKHVGAQRGSDSHLQHS